MNLNIEQLKYLDNLTKTDGFLSHYAFEALKRDSVKLHNTCKKYTNMLNGVVKPIGYIEEFL